MIIDLTEIINSKVILVLTIVLLKDRRYLLLSLISVRLRIHRLHEFDETYATCLLHIELRHYLVSGLAIRIETVLSEEEFEEINNLREYSLLKYYNTASKSRYTFICQNVLFL